MPATLARALNNEGALVPPEQVEWKTWGEFFALRDNADTVPDELMAERHLNTPLENRAVFNRQP